MENTLEQQAERLHARRVREKKNVFSCFSAVGVASRVQARQLLQASGGLSIVEWRTLWDLHEAGPMTIRDLAKTQRTDHSLLSRALPEMKRKGLVSTRRDAGDRRLSIIDLTEAGRAAYEQAAPVMKRRREALRKEFSPEELQAFIEFIDRFEAFLRLPIDKILTEEEEPQK